MNGGGGLALSPQRAKRLFQRLPIAPPLLADGCGYLPVTRFERETGYCPWYLAEMVLREIEGDCVPALPRRAQARIEDWLARRAGAIYVHNESYAKRARSRRGREAMLMFMRHWLPVPLSVFAPRCMVRPAGR